MPFAIRNLSVLAYANGFTLWLYKSARDTLHTISRPDHFADAADMLKAGDMIMVVGSDGGSIRVVTLSEATEPKNGVVMLGGPLGEVTTAPLS